MAILPTIYFVMWIEYARYCQPRPWLGWTGEFDRKTFYYEIFWINCFTQEVVIPQESLIAL
eukprot:snap_masked-scaffold_34-processed-gene-2.20-mRNA-1 protein AED:1.00 eAED:1.00 QI:0/0/0/0/1/1/2/0/60